MLEQQADFPSIFQADGRWI